jgi:hypothetical protein
MIRSSFHFCGAVLAASFLVTPASARPQMTAPATTEGDFVVHNFKFHSGELLPDVRLHYTTLGKPAHDAQGRTTNAVLILHGTGGSGHQFLAPYFAGELFGPGQPLAGVYCGVDRQIPKSSFLCSLRRRVGITHGG